MSRAARQPEPASRGERRALGGRHVSQSRVILSEWTKLRLLRSTMASQVAAVGCIVGLAVLVPLVTVTHWPPPEAGAAAAFDPTSRTLSGTFLAQLAVGVLGVLFVFGEYATGMIRATLAAVPARLPVLWAKTVVYGASPLVLTLPACLVAFLIGQASCRPRICKPAWPTPASCASSALRCT